MITSTKSKRLTRETLRQIPIVLGPLVTVDYKGMNHGQLADIFVKAANDAELSILEERWYAVRNGTMLVGEIIFNNSCKINNKHVGNNIMTVSHSNDGRNKIIFRYGASFFGINTGILSSFYSTQERIKTVDIVTTIAEHAVVNAQINWEEQERKLQKIADTVVVSEAEIALFILNELPKYDIINQKYAQEIWERFKFPHYAELSGNSLLSFVLSTAYVVGANLSPVYQMDFHIRFFSLICEYFGQ